MHLKNLQPFIMYDESHYFETNKQSWNSRVEVHVQSDFYDVPSFLAGKNALNSIELALLGDLAGKRVLHLQCHFGQDSLSLARLGARVVGVDFSEKAIERARALAKEASLEAEFVCCSVYDVASVLGPEQAHSFDIVFSSYGVIGWLPDLERWAAVVAHCLKPSGRFVFVEFHPVLWMFDNHFAHIPYSYFNREAIVEVEQGTYAQRDAPLQPTTVTWNHALSEVLGVLLAQGLVLNAFHEFDYSPYNCFEGTVEKAPGQFQLEKYAGKLPMVYALSASVR